MIFNWSWKSWKVLKSQDISTKSQKGHIYHVTIHNIISITKLKKNKIEKKNSFIQLLRKETE